MLMLVWKYKEETSEVWNVRLLWDGKSFTNDVLRKLISWSHHGARRRRITRGTLQVTFPWGIDKDYEFIMSNTWTASKGQTQNPFVLGMCIIAVIFLLYFLGFHTVTSSTWFVKWKNGQVGMMYLLDVVFWT